MFENLINTFISLDLLGLGSFIILFSLSIGISYLISNGSTKVFLYTMIIINYAMATGIFILTKEAVYFYLITLIIIIIMILPDGTSEIMYNSIRKKE